MEIPVLGEGVESLPVHEDDIHLLPLDGGQDFHAGGICIFMIGVQLIICQVEVCVELQLVFGHISPGVRHETFPELPGQILPGRHVHQSGIEDYVLVGDMSINIVSDEIQENAQDEQREFIIGQDMPDFLPAVKGVQIVVLQQYGQAFPGGCQGGL